MAPVSFWLGCVLLIQPCLCGEKRLYGGAPMVPSAAGNDRQCKVHSNQGWHNGRLIYKLLPGLVRRRQLALSWRTRGNIFATQLCMKGPFNMEGPFGCKFLDFCSP